MNKLLPLAAAALALMGGAPAASAATQIGEYLTFSGFGTLGAVQTDSDAGQFGKDRQPGGADKKANFDVDSNLGLQMTGKAASWLSGTVQVLAAKRADNQHIAARFEWAFVTVKPIDGLTLRGGRIAAPVFAISDSRNIGYANTWVRAPNEVYGLNVFTNLNGGDVVYRKTLGPVSVSATGFAGNTKFVSANGTYNEVKDVRGLSLLLESEWVSVRLSETKATVQPTALPSDPYTFRGVGVIVDRDNVVAQAEYVTRHSEGLATIIDAKGWYVMGGYRFGSVTPYVIVSSTSPKTPSSRVLFSAAQKTTALGARWDAFRSAAIKLQLERIDTANTKGISFTTPGAGLGRAPLTEPVTALSVALDFAF